MKNLFFTFICFLGFQQFTVTSMRAQSCATGKPMQADSLKFASEGFTATLVGWDELDSPSSPPRKYLTCKFGGSIHGDVYNNEPTCGGPRNGGYFDITYSGQATISATTGLLVSSGTENVSENSGPSTLQAVSAPWKYESSCFSTAAYSQTMGIAASTGSCCVSVLPSRQIHSGTITEELIDEDTEDDAENRATKVQGTSNLVFRTKRTTGFTFSGSKTHVTATFKKCPGDYNIFLVYTDSTHFVQQREQVDFQHSESGEFTFDRDFSIGTAPCIQQDVTYSIIGVEAERLCAAGEGGSSGSKVDSIAFWMNLGRSSGETSAGQLRIDSSTIGTAIYSPASLKLVTSQPATITEPVTDGSGVLRQVRTPQCLTDIVVLDANSYEARFYSAAQIGAQDPGTKIYPVSDSPFVVYKIENPDPIATQPNRLRITETRGSLTKITEYIYDVSSNSWTLSQGGGLRNESLITSTLANGDTLQTRTVLDSAGQNSSKVSETYHAFAWGLELISSVSDPDGAALTTNYTYYTDQANDGTNYGKIKQRVDGNGSWERFTYNTTGQVLKSIRPFLDAPASTSDETLCRVTENTYTTIPDVDGDALPETMIQTVERTLGQETARRYRIDWSNSVSFLGDMCKRRSDIVCVTAGALWNAAGNLTTDTLRLASGPLIDRVRRTINPDGTVNLIAYALDGNGQLTTSTKSGAANTTKDGVVAGTLTAAVVSSQGYTIAETNTDIASNIVLNSWTATQLDPLGRPTRLDYADGTYVTRDYACCGLASERDRTGITTTYVYDEVGRLTDTTRDGIRTHSTYDGDGRVKSVTRVGTDDSQIVQETDTYDLAGRLTQRFDALNRPTGYAEVYDNVTGHTTRTTTNPDTGTVIELFARDGSRLSVTGTAAAPHNYDYGLDSGVLYTKDTLVGLSGATTEWVKAYTDFAGRSFKTVYPDNATAQSYFNTLGQISRQVDPDGVTTLFGYNARGEQETVAIDLNGNNNIDFDGTDRITTTVNDVANHGAYVVQRTTTQVYETDGQATPTTVSVNETATDGLHSWQTTRGLSSSSVTTLNGSGARTAVATAPDSTTTTQVYSANHLQSSVTSNPSVGTLSSVTYDYDAHGRLHTANDVRTGVTTYSYYDDDQIHTVLSPDPDTTRSGSGYDAQTTTYTYDLAGRADTITQPDGTVVNTIYYPAGQVKRTWGSRTYPTEYTYDPQGRVKTLTTWQDFAGNTGQAVTTWNYTPDRGFLQNKRYADNTGPAYTYKPSGRLWTRVWARTPVITTTYGYTTAGDLQSIIYSDATPAVGMTYDRTGRPNSTADAAGSHTISYDASGQLKDEDYTAGLLITLGVHRTYDAQAHLSGISGVSNSTTIYQAAYDYDAASRLQTVTAGINTASYGYVPNASLVQTVTLKQGDTTRLTTTKSYDNFNRLSTITNTPSVSTASSVAYTYNDANQRIKSTREDNAYWNYGYDSLGQVTSGKKFDATDAALPGYDFGWTYDDIGNRKTATVNNQSATYQPNNLNQYIQRTIPGAIDVTGASSTTSTVTVSLNNGTPQATVRSGELFYKQLAVVNTANAQNPSIAITGVKNLVGAGGEDAVTTVTKNSFLPATPESFTYDDDGNLTDDARWHYTWDGENRLIAMETAASAYAPIGPLLATDRRKLEFSYDGQSRRIGKRVSNWDGTTWVVSSNVLFLYDGWNLLAELNALSSNAVTCTYTWGQDLSGSLQGAGGVGGLLISNFAASASAHGVEYDGNGNVIGLVDMATGIKSATYDYNAFGETIQSDGVVSVANHFRFSTKYTDDDTGLLYYGLRYYGTNIGRWLSRDFSGESEGGVNLYAMLANDSLSKLDFLGLWSVDEHYDIINKWLAARRSKLPSGSTYSDYNWHCMFLNVQQDLKDGNDDIDGTGRYTANFWSAQATENSFQHAMRAPNQTIQDAEAKMNQFVNEEVSEAKNLATDARQMIEKGDNAQADILMNEAIHHLGRAQHPIADMTSPLHYYFKVWYGLATIDALGHHLRENAGLYSQQGDKPFQYVMSQMDANLDDVLQQ